MTAEPNPKVIVIILNWNKTAITHRCIESLFSSDYPNYKVIVIDNGSTEISEMNFESLFPSIQFIRNEENKGYTGGNNQGIEHALNEGAKYIWLLNNDALVEKNTLSELVNACEQDSGIGLAHSIILDNPIEKNLLYCGSFIDMENGIFRTAKEINTILDWQKNYPENIALWGTALLINVDCYKAVGNLDDHFFAYFEDMDYSIRVKKAGFTCKVIISSAIFHEKRSLNNREYPYYYNFYMARNNYLFWKNNLTDHNKIMKYHLHYVIPKATYFFLEGSDNSARATIDGSWNGIKLRFGPMENHLEPPRFIYSVFRAFPRIIYKISKWLLR